MNSNARGIHNSPNIYTTEIDVSSYSTKSLGATTLGLVGETLIGPAFQPVSISSYNEFVTYFGGTNPEKYANGYPKYELGYIAKSYLKQSQQLYVTRVLGLSGYQFDGLWALYIASGPSGSTKTHVATLRSKSHYVGEVSTAYVKSIDIVTSGITSIGSDFTIVTNVTGQTHNVSLNPLKKNYILKVLGSTFNASKSSNIFVEEMYEDVITNSLQSDGTTFQTGTSVGFTDKRSGHDDYRDHFSYAKTPWFTSELKGTQIVPLFRFLTLSDGENANGMFKISVRNVDIDTLTFDIIIRAIYDTDAKPVILEQFNNCTLDPADGNYYLGAQVGTVDNVYKLQSKCVIVEILDDDKVRESVPMGFEGYQVKNISGITEPAVTYNAVYTDTGSSAAKKTYFGISNTTGVDTDMFAYKGKGNLALTKGFHLEPSASGVTFVDPYSRLICSGFTTPGISTYNDYIMPDKKLMKFTAYFAGGFDGWDIFRENRTNTDGFQFNGYKEHYSGQIGSELGKTFIPFGDKQLGTVYDIPDVPVTTGITSDFYAFWSAARAFSDPEAIDVNVIATPGIDFVNNGILTNEIIDMVENERKDSIYIMTTPDKAAMAPNGLIITDSKNDMLNANDITGALIKSCIDSNYTATYYPWCQYYDSDNGVYVYLPATRDVVRNIAYTDNIAYSWFPPAGIGRGTVDCVKAKTSLVLEDEDTLYSNRINVIKTFALDGVKIWGQKTLQIADTALNRIGVRRMMLYLRKAVRRSNLPLIFEPNDNTTKNKFLEIVNPILNSVKTNRGLSDYKILIDDSAEAKDRHEMNVKIWIKPIGALEYINIDFMITPEGFDFSTL